MVAALALAARPIAAQQPDQASPTLVINQVDASAYPDIRVVMTALDGAGVPVAGLTAAEFSASPGDDMTVASVEHAEDTTLQLAVILVVDTSGSMQGAPLEAAKQAARQFVAQLGPNDRASVVAFSDGVRSVVPLTGDAAALTAGIDGLTAAGATSLYEAVQAAVFIARTSGAPRQAIVFLSDGENDTATSQATEAGSLDIARANGVPIFAIGFGQAADTGYLQRLSAETRGQFFAADAADVGAVYGAIAGLLRSQYIVTLRAGAEADGQEATLQVAANIGGQTVTSQPVAFRRGEAPPTPPPAPTQAPPPGTNESDSGGGSGTAIGIGALATLVGIALAGGGFFAVRRAAAARRQRERERHSGRQSDEPVPPPRDAPIAPARPTSAGRLVAIAGEHAGVTFELGDVPLIVGSDASAALRLAPSRDVAPRHASIWMRDGKVTLRHTGGRHPTYVEGRPVDLVVLEPGDEITIGANRFVVEVVPVVPR